MLKLIKFNINIFLWIFEVRAKGLFTVNTVKIEETETDQHTQLWSQYKLSQSKAEVLHAEHQLPYENGRGRSSHP